MSLSESHQVIIIIIASVSLILSLLAQRSKRYTPALLFLLAASLGIFLLASLLDPFLNLWDERFHALVAKNLLHHPLMPTLYDDPVVQMAYDRWDRTVIWLHKQPLFLWQIALSFRLFGVNEFALRLPSVLMSTGLVYFAYRIGLLVINQRTGYIAGLLTATSYHLIELVSGRTEVDHNDVAFLFYVTASIWAWTEYISTKKKYWILLVGLFAGFGVLCKWMVGLLVYSGWGLYNLMVYRVQIKKYAPILTAFGITVLIVMPWQILIYSWYPAEAQDAMQYNLLHFTKALEGHSGTPGYYFEHFGDLFGKATLYLIFPSIIVFLVNVKDKPYGKALFFMPLVVYLFFSIAATKMPSYPFVIAVLIYLLTASGIAKGLEYIQRLYLPVWISGLISILLLAAVIHLNLQPAKIIDTHILDSSVKSYRQIQSRNKKIFKELKDLLPAETVIFNVKGRHYVECMFYTGFPSYSFLPTEEQVIELLSKGKAIAVFPEQNEVLPLYLTSNRAVSLIPEYLQGWE